VIPEALTAAPPKGRGARKLIAVVPSSTGKPVSVRLLRDAGGNHVVQCRPKHSRRVHVISLPGLVDLILAGETTQAATQHSAIPDHPELPL
jgi:hypothetical protein